MHGLKNALRAASGSASGMWARDECWRTGMFIKLSSYQAIVIVLGAGSWYDDDGSGIR